MLSCVFIDPDAHQHNLWINFKPNLKPKIRLHFRVSAKALFLEGFLIFLSVKIIFHLLFFKTLKWYKYLFSILNNYENAKIL